MKINKSAIGAASKASSKEEINWVSIYLSEIKTDAIKEAKVWMTFVGGKKVYARE